MNVPSGPDTVSRNMPGFLVAHDDGDARQHGALRVDDAAPQLGRALLCRRRHGDEQDHQDRAHYTLLHTDCLLSLHARKTPY